MAGAEAELNFSDEGDVEVGESAAQRAVTGMAALAGELGEWLARPAAEVIAEGLSVVIAGPPNAGNSTLLNALAKDRKSVVKGKSVSVRVDIGGRRYIKKKKNIRNP